MYNEIVYGSEIFALIPIFIVVIVLVVRLISSGITGNEFIGRVASWIVPTVISIIFSVLLTLGVIYKVAGQVISLFGINQLSNVRGLAILTVFSSLFVSYMLCIWAVKYLCKRYSSEVGFTMGRR